MLGREVLSLSELPRRLLSRHWTLRPSHLTVPRALSQDLEPRSRLLVDSAWT